MSRTRTTTLIILVGLLAGIITMMSSTLTSASAYKPDDPAAKYHCFATDADGKYNLRLGDLLWRLSETEELCKHPSHGVYNDWYHCHPMGIIRI